MVVNEYLKLTWIRKGVVERYKTCLVINGFTENEGFDFKETFSSVSTKESFGIIMIFVIHFDIELHLIVYKLNKSISEIKQISRQW